MNAPKETTVAVGQGGRSATGKPADVLSEGFNPVDIYYVLFRRKWLITFSLLTSLAAAGYLYLARSTAYRSDARLLVRYVRESRAIDSTATSGQAISPVRGDDILNAELEILTSYDLAAEVANLVGPDKLLAGVSGAAPTAAVTVIQRGLLVEVPRRSNAIRLVFRHADPETAQAVLSQLIASYRRKHAEVHRGFLVADEFFTKKTDELRSRLTQTEEELRLTKAKAGVIRVEETKQSIAQSKSRIQQELLAAESELAEHRAVLQQVHQASGAHSTNATLSITNSPPAVAEPPLDPETLTRYRDVRDRIAAFRSRELDLISEFGDENGLVKDVRLRLAEMEKVRSALEAANPRLLAVSTSLTSARDGAGVVQPVFSVEAASSKVGALEARIRYLTSQMEKVKSESAVLDANESRINELERRRALEETNYLYFAANLEQARVDQALGAGNLPNISVVQEASPAYREASQALKLIAMVLIGGSGAGLGLAFLLEFFIDRTIRRPSQVISQLRLPLFLTIPTMRLNRRRTGQRRSRLPAGEFVSLDAAAARGTQLLPGKADSPDLTSRDHPASIGEVTTPQPQSYPNAVSPEGQTSDVTSPGALALTMTVDPLALYHEALRDRLVMYFEINGLTHRPKLVGVTGSGPGAGTTTIAAGLAASLSETGDGNVLLVDMNQRNGAGVHPFYRGRAMCGINEALEQDTRRQALVQDNLYVVTAHNGAGHKVGLVPRKFANIVPRLQAADYDYIIFDLPPVSQTSVTSKLAGLLDMTLLILESEKAKQDNARNALGLLADSKARVAAVLNKYKPYVPRRLQADC